VAQGEKLRGRVAVGLARGGNLQGNVSGMPDGEMLTVKADGEIVNA
jgi:hypothetical protein